LGTGTKRTESSVLRYSAPLTLRGLGASVSEDTGIALSRHADEGKAGSADNGFSSLGHQLKTFSYCLNDGTVRLSNMQQVGPPGQLLPIISIFLIAPGGKAKRKWCTHTH
ncbi:hypothetical protein BgiBS90_033447, partial [Biomphalaria glabrata]